MSTVLSHALGYLLLGGLLAAIIGFTTYACWLPVAFVLALLKVPKERQALGAGVLISPLAFFLLSGVAASVDTGYGPAVTGLMGLVAGVASFVLMHRFEPHEGRRGRELFAPIADWWRKNIDEAQRSSQVEAARRARDAAPTITGPHHHPHARRWSVWVYGASFTDKGYFMSEDAALEFVKRWEKKGARRRPDEDQPLPAQ